MTETAEATATASSRDSIRRVFANPNLRRVQLAYAGSIIGDWTYGTALTVWAYLEGGATAVGIFTAVRFIAMAIAGPLGALVADRVARRRFMVATDLVRAVLVAGAAAVIALDGPAAITYALGIVVAVVGSPFRSAQAGLIPKLVDRPDELTASNAVAGNLENVATFAGPALGALLVGATTVEIAFLFNVATFLWSAALVAAIRVTAATSPDAEPADDEGAPSEGFVREVSAGFATVVKDGDLRTVSLLAAAQGFIWGVLMVFTIVIAVQQLGTGPSGVGYLDATMGVATVVGGLVVLTRVARGRLGQDMAIGVLGWALPLLVLAAFPHPVTAFAALAVIGLSDPWVNVGLETIPQRLAPERVISRVYAAVESSLIGAMALGSAVAPVLIELIGFRESLAAVGVVVAGYTITTFPRMRRLDARLTEPATLPLLRSIALFAPLSPPTLESLARQLVPVSVPAGEVVVAEREASDRFYVIAAGSVEVTQEGRLLRTETAGDFFGEIGLIRDVPRTATVTATTDTELFALERGDFLEAVSGARESRTAAEEVVARRLAV